MNVRTILLAVAMVMAIATTPAFANTGHTPPGGPCLKNNGNPCNGNNGNPGEQGNAGHEKVHIDKKPPPIELAMPPVTGRSVYISQIGEGNIASVTQNAPHAYAKIDQDGDSNEADVLQTGTGKGYVQATQTGSGNFARLQQDGIGQNVAYVAQTGNANWARISQNASGTLHNAARMVQSGNYNDMQLLQDGGDNRALLTQEGDYNSMAAVQLGESNRLIWTQQGSNLSDLQVTQSGGNEKGGQLMITQTGAN